MPHLDVMFKTVSTDCNVDCAYCYYRESHAGARGRHLLSLELLERFMAQYMAYIADVGSASLSWQGGEPTLAGLAFFERVVELEARYARPGTTIANALQTNGVLLDDRWGQFLRRYDVLVGISIDGPKEVHDELRRTRSGRGTFDDAMRGVDVLRRHGVEHNALCVVRPGNVERPAELLRFFRGQGFTHVQLVPAMDFQATAPGRPARYLITAEEYGEFLCGAFDEWYQGGRPTLSVGLFDSLLQRSLGLPASVCVNADRCHDGIVVEHDGAVYPCDFFIHRDHGLGSLATTPLAEIVDQPRRRAFAARKLDPVPRACVGCSWLAVCGAGCPRNRGPGPGPDLFCAAYRQLLDHARDRLDALRARLLGRR
jgi:uncharacterized protein